LPWIATQQIHLLQHVVATTRPTFATIKASNNSTGDDIVQANGKNASIKIAKLSLRKLLEQNPPQKQEDNVCDSLLKASKVELLEI